MIVFMYANLARAVYTYLCNFAQVLRIMQLARENYCFAWVARIDLNDDRGTSTA